MKKVILLVFLLSMMFSTCFAFTNAYEPESNNAVSFSTYSLEDGKNEFTFVNYATDKGNNDYWLRFSVRNSNDKLLYYATLIIENEEYQLLSDEPNTKYQYAAQSLIDTGNSPSLFGNSQVIRYDFRYFPLSAEILNKLKTSQNVSFIFNTVKRINVYCKLDNNFVTDINKTFAYKYGDFKSLWSPKDLKVNLKK